MKFKFITAYWTVPGGRGLDHLASVLDAAKALAGRDLTLKEELTMRLHDVGVGRPGWSRDDHPVAAIEAIDCDEQLASVRPMVDDEMREAILLHMRDRYEETGLVSPIHQLLVEADEGRPVWGLKRIEKPVKYWLAGRNKALPVGAPLDDVVAHVMNVLRRKADAFKSGKPPFTDRYCSVFASEIKEATDWAMSVNPDYVEACIERLRKGGEHETHYDR